jgi:hypothetical protein
MHKWEYAVVGCIQEEPFLSEALAEKGEEGWELVSVVRDDNEVVDLYFKRPL